MPKVVGVRFREAGKIYQFDPLNFKLEKGDHVIVETSQGTQIGNVVDEIMEIPDELIKKSVKPIIRIATQADIKKAEGNKKKEKEAFGICKEKIKFRKLEMELVDVEYSFDESKIIFYFTADGRVDFRELVKDLAGIFRNRIELRQIGVRDEAKMIGGLGICGRELCCCSFLNNFVPVSIKMAKEQNLSMNPSKISGACGRLLCCLKYEQEAYEYANSKMPKPGTRVMTNDGKGVVEEVDLLREFVKVKLDKGDETDLSVYKLEEINVIKKGCQSSGKCPRNNRNQ